MLANKQIIDMICFQEESKTGKVGLFGSEVAEKAYKSPESESRKISLNRAKVAERVYKSGIREQKNQPKQPESVRKGLQIRHRRAEESA